MKLKRAEYTPDIISDEMLMIRIGDGDRTAYGMLVDRHLRSFLAFATRLTGDFSEAEDIMQEAFVRVWKYAARWDQARNTRYTTWFYRIVMNLCIDLKRKKKPASALSEAFDVESADALPDARLSDRQMASRLAAALAEIPPRQKVALTLCYLQGMGNKEAAEVMDITIGAVESLLVRGRAKMAELLEEQKDELLREII